MSEAMRLNNLKPAEGHKKGSKRVGRGIGSGLGKTCGSCLLYTSPSPRD